MFSCCSLPTEALRWVVLVGLIVFEVFFVMRKHNRAGLTMLAGTTLDLLSAVVSPVVEIAGFAYTVNASGGPPSGLAVAGWFLIPMLGRLTIAIHLLLLGIGIGLLAQELPDEERSWD